MPCASRAFHAQCSELGKAGAAVHARTSVRKPSRCPGGGLACSGVQRMHLCVCVREERFQALPRCYERTAGRFERHERHRGAMVAPRSVSEARKRFKTRVFGRGRVGTRTSRAEPHVRPPGPPLGRALSLCSHLSSHLKQCAAGEQAHSLRRWSVPPAPARGLRPISQEILPGDYDLRLLARKKSGFETPRCQNPLKLDASIPAFGRTKKMRI